MTNLPDLITFAFGVFFFWGQLRRIRRQFFVCKMAQKYLCWQQLELVEGLSEPELNALIGNIKINW